MQLWRRQKWVNTGSSSNILWRRKNYFYSLTHPRCKYLQYFSPIVVFRYVWCIQFFSFRWVCILTNKIKALFSPTICHALEHKQYFKQIWWSFMFYFLIDGITFCLAHRCKTSNSSRLVVVRRVIFLCEFVNHLIKIPWFSWCHVYSAPFHLYLPVYTKLFLRAIWSASAGPRDPYAYWKSIIFCTASLGPTR